jgi:signal transduction histidine kinase
MAQHLGAPIRFDAPAEPIVLAMADRESLEQMVVNLLVNAVQATAQAMAYVGGPANGDGSGVESPETEVTLQLSQSGPNRVRIAVIDRGPGPSAAVVDRLFEPFATDKPGGTGLGLVVARRIAEDHGGSIEWRRHEEQTWFIAELPLNSEGEG